MNKQNFMFDNSQINVFNAIKGSRIYGSLNDLIFVLGMKTACECNLAQCWHRMRLNNKFYR
jgi:hypothetical protein